MIIQLDYTENFQCYGKICGSRCCRDWQIKVDEETYKKFLSLDKKSRAEVLENLEEEKNYFALKMTEQGFCKFLDDDFLCKLQKKHGENFLTAICQTFPRVVYKLDKKIFQQSMTLTCPVAAQMILLSPEKINLVEGKKINSRLVIDFTKKLSHPPKKFLQLQTQAIEILQDRNFSIDERLKKLCAFFCKKNLPPFKFDLAKHSATMIKIFEEMYDANLNEEKKKIFLANYMNNREKILRQVHENFSYVLENYLVNEFFMRCYPCAFVGDDWQNCKIFVASFKFLEFSLVLTTLSKRTLTVENLLELICSVNDRLDHSKGGMDAIKNFVENNDAENFFEVTLQTAET